MSAYTQMKIADAARLLGKDVFPETWVSLPPSRRPASWADRGIKDPVVPLTLNLYGHPLAGLLWDKGSREKILQAGFEPVQGWECLYIHKAYKVVLTLYVDDFHAAGDKEGMPKMWKALRATGLALEDPKPFHGSVYLGCGTWSALLLHRIRTCIEFALHVYLHCRRFACAMYMPLHLNCICSCNCF